MKKIISLLLVFLIIFSLTFTLVGCSDEEDPTNENNGENEDDIPDWSELGGENDIVLPPVKLEPIG